MPFHALAQLERDPFSVLAPAPALGQIRNDRVQAFSRFALIEQHQVVEHRHERVDRRYRRLLVNGRRRRIIAVVVFERAAVLLCQCRLDGKNGAGQNRSRDGEYSRTHLFLPGPPALDLRAACRLCSLWRWSPLGSHRCIAARRISLRSVRDNARNDARLCNFGDQPQNNARNWRAGGTLDHICKACARMAGDGAWVARPRR